MLAGKKLTDFTSLFSPYDFEKTMIQFWVISKMNECNSAEINKTNLSEQKKFWLSEITGIENYFHHEINQKKICIKQLSKYVTAFDYIDRFLIVLSATTGGVSIISFASIVGAPVEIASASFTLIFSLMTGIIKKLLSITRNKKKKHNKILVLFSNSKSKLNSMNERKFEETKWKTRKHETE